jgi:hypothetical protein
VETGNEILTGLSRGGRDLVFVDDTGTSGKPIPVLASDFRLLCAVILPSDRYDAVKRILSLGLRKLDPGLREFHATEIVNPGSRSPWKAVSIAKRLEALGLLGDQLLTHAELVAFVYVSGEQFNAELLPRILERGGPQIDYKAALADVFFKVLLQFMRRKGEEMAIVVDSPHPLPNEIKIQGVRDPMGVYQGGIIYSESWREEGLQLADIAAYTLNRAFHIKQRRADGKGNRFDEAIDRLFERLRPKALDLLIASQVLGLRDSCQRTPPRVARRRR